MNRLVSSMVFGALSSLVFACGASSPSPAPQNNASTASSTPHVIDREDTPQSVSCPAPKQTTEMCAAVMVYVKIGDACCAYGSPCEAADGKKFSDSKCTSP